MEILKTPPERFRDLPGFPYAPRAADVGGLEMAYIDEGPRDAAPALLLHGEPSWGFLYRKMMPPLLDAGLRVVVPDLIGFGRSDKPAARADYTYQRHVDWVKAFIAALDLRDVTLFCQDWGGLIGLRIVGEEGQRFARVVAANTFLPTGHEPVPESFHRWRRFSQETPELAVGWLVARSVVNPLPPEVQAAYDAPFPDERYKAGARQFPLLVPITPDDPAAEANRAAWRALMRWPKPFLTAFSDRDPITRGGDVLLRAAIPGARGVTVAGGGHFLQEDCGEELGRIVVDFVRSTA
jgi:haloalkane dehalogenase